MIKTSGDIVANGGDIILPKTAGKGMKVDETTPTWGRRDLEGVEIPDPAGGDAPTLSIYSGGIIRENAYANGDKLDIRFHIPHDLVPNSDMYIHIHWSHNGTAISGNAVFTVTSQYSKGHNQANFGTEKTLTITYNTVDIATTPRYRHRIDEILLSNNGGTGNLLDSTQIEVDGLILMNVTMTTNPTITGGSPNNVFIHRVDIHYQSTNMPTKNKAPNFYS